MSRLPRARGLHGLHRRGFALGLHHLPGSVALVIGLIVVVVVVALLLRRRG